MPTSPRASHDPKQGPPVDVVGGLRLAVAFLGPVGLGLLWGRTLEGLFVGVGAFMVANADLGESFAQRLRLMVPATAGVVGLTAAGMIVGVSDWVAVPVGAAVFFAGGLAAAAGAEAGLFGTFASFAFAIGVGLAPVGVVTIGQVAVTLVVGGAFAIMLSLVDLLARGHRPDSEPEPWATLWQRIRARADRTLWLQSTGLAAAGGIALAVVPFTHQSNGAWLVTGALIVLKPGYTDTIRIAVVRAACTVVGAAIAGAIALVLTGPWALLAVAFASTWAAEALIRRSFAVFVVLITPLSVLLTNVIVPGDVSVAVLRIADVAAGSLIAIVVVTALRLPQLLARR